MKPYPAGPQDVEKFRVERVLCRLAFRCPDCVYVVPSTGACSFEYPNRTLLEADAYLDEVGQFVFCKYFELG